MSYLGVRHRSPTHTRPKSPARVVEVLESRTLLANGITPSGGPQFTGTSGTPVTNVTVASFTVVDPSGAPGTKWRANVDWGDGVVDRQVSPVQDSTTAFHFAANHTYASPRTYTVTVMIAVPGSGRPNDNTVTTTAVIAPGATRSIPPGDYNADNKTDLAVFRPATAQWLIRYFDTGAGRSDQFGDPAQGDVAVPGDFEGNNHTDLAVYRPSTADWLIRLTSGTLFTRQFGDPTQHDVPVPGDYEGIGKADLAVYRPSTGHWLIRTAGGGTLDKQFGDPTQGDVPVPGDYEGIGKADLAVYRPSTGHWLIRTASGATLDRQFGDPSQGDVPAPGDYEGIGKTDLAVYRPSTGHWLILTTDAGVLDRQFGDPAHHDIPAGLPVGSLKGFLPGSVRPATPPVSGPAGASGGPTALAVIPQADAGPVIAAPQDLTPGSLRKRQATANAWLAALDQLVAERT